MQNSLELVEKKYKELFDELGDKKIHFASRMFLWSGDDFAREKLEKIRKEYIGESERQHREMIVSLLEKKHGTDKILFKKERDAYFCKYPSLKTYNKILFKNLFCKTLYGIDLRPTIKEFIPDHKFLELKKTLEKDPEAIAALSTHAVNYLYTLDFYLNYPGSSIKPEAFLDIVEKELEPTQEPRFISLKLYLLTHCIIGASAFYYRKIGKDIKTYKKMLLIAEKEISENFDSVSLDNKFEFLVCAKLCDFHTYLKGDILREAHNSFDPVAGYIVEVKNKNTGKKGTLMGAEHRNVLALMAFGAIECRVGSLDK